MTWKRTLLLAAAALALFLVGSQAAPPAEAAPDILASPLQASCYQSRPDRCKIHVEPFTITVASGKKLVFFSLVTTNQRDRAQLIIYHFKPDVSNPVPLAGNTFTPSRVAKDFAATCGEVYSVSLQGQDTGDLNAYNLGSTGWITCPTGQYSIMLPVVRK